jgi:hypothetical protein
VAGHGRQGARPQLERTGDLFDSVGFAIEDFSALRYVRDKLIDTGLFEELDLLADPDEPRDLFGMLLRAGVRSFRLRRGLWWAIGEKT